MRKSIYFRFLSIILVIGTLLCLGVFVKMQVAGKAGRNTFYPSEYLLNRAMVGDTVAVRQLLLDGADPNTPPGANDKGMTALMFAAWGGHAEIVRLLIRAGASVNAVSGSGATALMFASQSGYVDVVQDLILQGNADPDIQSPNGETALSLATSSGHLNIVSFLSTRGAARNSRTNGERVTPLMKAILREDREAVNLLLDSNPDLEIKDRRGRTALVYAVIRGNMGIVARLLERGADPNTRDLNQRSLLRFARMLGNAQITELLRANGAR